MNRCSCRSQIIRSASILRIPGIDQEKPDWEFVRRSITRKIYESFSENRYVITRPNGDCPSLKTLPFVIKKRIPRKIRNYINARKQWILNELRSLGAFDDVLDHVNKYNSGSPELTSLTQALFFGTRFVAGRHLVEQLVNYIDLEGNQLINSVYDPEFHENNKLYMFEWAAILKLQANLADDAASRAKLLANYLINLGMTTNPASQSAVRQLTKANCWNLFSKTSLP